MKIDARKLSRWIYLVDVVGIGSPSTAPSAWKELGEDLHDAWRDAVCEEVIRSPRGGVGSSTVVYRWFAYECAACDVVLDVRSRDEAPPPFAVRCPKCGEELTFSASWDADASRGVTVAVPSDGGSSCDPTACFGVLDWDDSRPPRGVDTVDTTLTNGPLRDPGCPIHGLTARSSARSRVSMGSRNPLVWHPDPAASGPRDRAWVDDDAGNRLGEIAVYATGDWYVYTSRYKHQANGAERDLETAKRRALAVFESMTRPIDQSHPTE